MTDASGKQISSDTTILSQSEADRLISIEKECLGDKKYTYPSPSESLEISLQSTDKREQFKLTIRPGKISISKVTNQLREKNTNTVLVRVDIGNVKHTNPDDTVIEGNHIHLYKEGYEDTFAYPLPSQFTNPQNPYVTLDEFMKYCQVTKVPVIIRGIDQW